MSWVLCLLLLEVTDHRVFIALCLIRTPSWPLRHHFRYFMCRLGFFARFGNSSANCCLSYCSSRFFPSHIVRPGISLVQTSSRNVITISFPEWHYRAPSPICFRKSSPFTENEVKDSHKNLTKRHSISISWHEPHKHSLTPYEEVCLSFYSVDSDTLERIDLHFLLLFSVLFLRCWLCLSSRLFCRAVLFLLLCFAKPPRALLFIGTWCHFRSECHTHTKARFSLASSASFRRISWWFDVKSRAVVLTN